MAVVLNRLQRRLRLVAARGRDRSDGARQRGSAIVDFALVGGLLTVMFMAIVQLALVLHVRNTLIDAASSGARYGVLADRTPADAKTRSASLIGSALSDRYAQNISVATVEHLGLRTLQVTVRAPMPVIGLIGPAGVLEVSGHAAVAD